MKIGIVTWYKNGNFGGTLQAYSLYSVLKNKGNDVEFINYSIDNKFSKKVIRKFKNFVFSILYPVEHASRKEIWKFVKHNLNESKPMYDYQDLIKYSKKYDYVICGSDQIWSLVNGLDKYYFLDFVEPIKRISYAPSIGYNQIDENYKSQFSNYISQFKYLSVREQKGQELIKNVSNRDAEVVLDPTLLLTKDDWISFSRGSKKQIDKKYILCYFLENNKDYISFAEHLKEKTGLELIYINSKKIKHYHVQNKKKCGVEDFVNYINNAEYVLTDSFHGLAFSINLNKKFAIFKRFSDVDTKSQNSRIYNLLRMTTFNDFIIDPKSDVDILINKKFDYDITNERISNERQKSLNYLDNAISK